VAILGIQREILYLHWINREVAEMNKYTCATCGTEHTGDIPDSWLTRGDPKNEIYFCSRVCLEIKLLDDEYKMFDDTNKYRLTFPQ